MIFCCFRNRLKLGLTLHPCSSNSKIGSGHRSPAELPQNNFAETVRFFFNLLPGWFRRWCLCFCGTICRLFPGHSWFFCWLVRKKGHGQAAKYYLDNGGEDHPLDWTELHQRFVSQFEGRLEAGANADGDVMRTRESCYVVFSLACLLFDEAFLALRGTDLEVRGLRTWEGWGDTMICSGLSGCLAVNGAWKRWAGASFAIRKPWYLRIASARPKWCWSSC